MNTNLKNAKRKVAEISAAGFEISDTIEVGDKKFWLTSLELQEILDSKLAGLNLQGLPLRTRSKVVKSAVCNALGYPVPKSFKKTQPRFIGQQFDTYTQKSNNLQVWNEDLDSIRRYVLIRIGDDDLVKKVKVVSGSDLAPLDTTGTLTQKYQAKLNAIIDKFELVSKIDNGSILSLCSQNEKEGYVNISPIEDPVLGQLLPIKDLFDKIKHVVGQTFPDPGSDQERNRGAELHKLVCNAIGYKSYQDDGRFPDVRNQLLEIKLQTSTTIDLGLITPDSENFLDMEKINGIGIRHCDVRYAIFFATNENGVVTIKNLIVTKGQDFFGRFPQFGGKVLNKKIQIRLPKGFFDT